MLKVKSQPLLAKSPNYIKICKLPITTLQSNKLAFSEPWTKSRAKQIQLMITLKDKLLNCKDGFLIITWLMDLLKNYRVPKMTKILWMRLEDSKTNNLILTLMLNTNYNNCTTRITPSIYNNNN